MLAGNRMAKLDYEQRLHATTKRSPTRRASTLSPAARNHAFDSSHVAAALPRAAVTTAVYSAAAALPSMPPAGMLSNGNSSGSAAVKLTPEKLKRLAAAALRSSGSSSGSSRRGSRTPGSARRTRSRLQCSRASAADEQQRRRRQPQQQQYGLGEGCESDYEDCEDQHTYAAHGDEQGDSETAVDRSPSPIKDQQPAGAAAAAAAATAAPGDGSMLATARFWVGKGASSVQLCQCCGVTVGLSSTVDAHPCSAVCLLCTAF
jgi:hypothetical protein